MRLSGSMAGRIAAALLIVALPTAGAQAQARPAATLSDTGQPEVWLMRGLLNVFSFGMDELAASLRAAGVRARVENHLAWSAIAGDILARRRAGQPVGRIVLVGHSLGANNVYDAAALLGRHGVPVHLVVSIDPTERRQAPANVMRVVNYYQSGGAGAPVWPGRASAAGCRTPTSPATAATSPGANP